MTGNGILLEEDGCVLVTCKDCTEEELGVGFSERGFSDLLRKLGWASKERKWRCPTHKQFASKPSPSS